MAETKKPTLKEILSLHIAPHKHFERVILGTLLALAFVLAGEGYMLLRVESGAFLVTDTSVSTTTETVDSDKLTKVLKRYNQKQKVRDTALLSSPAVTDPSN